MKIIPQITTETCKRRMVDALRDDIGPGKPMAYEAAAEALGFDYRTLTSYALGENLPSLPKLLRLFALLGPGFANRVLHMAGLGGCYRQEVRDVPDLELNADVAKMIGDLGQAFRRGRVTSAHAQPNVMRDARLLMEDLQNWISEHDELPAQNRADGGEKKPLLRDARAGGNA